MSIDRCKCTCKYMNLLQLMFTFYFRTWTYSGTCILFHSPQNYRSDDAVLNEMAGPVCVITMHFLPHL